MRNITLHTLLGSLLLLTSCNKDKVKPISESINIIMPLGASRVEGGLPDYESFRYELWKDLVDGGWDFDFIGTQNDDESAYGEYAGNVFDIDHEGRGGWTTSQIADGIEQWLELVGSPDIVLFSSPGGNDALNGEPYDQAITNINTIIDLLQTNNPEVTILIEVLAPAKAEAMTPELTAFMDDLKTDIPTIATAQSTAISNVIVVDMSDGFSESFYADDVHYNTLGADFVATKYYDILSTILN
tara:strand:+ start:31 stop:759 length:729 start_codon:yes stop_codon:yes gene_type:complete